MESGTGTGGVAEEELTNDKPTSDDEIKNLWQLFKNINLNKHIVDMERVDRMLATIANHSTIDPRTLSSDEPRDWEDSQQCSPTEAAEWRAAFEDKIKSLKDMGVYKLIP